jgi:hypothetical protein
MLPTPTPRLELPTLVCQGEELVLDASASLANGCPNPLEYRFREGATTLQDWSTSMTHGPVFPSGPTVYTVDVRCVAEAVCEASIAQTVDVSPTPTALLDLPDLICEGAELMLDASGSDPNGCTTALEYRFRDGATVLQDWSTTATFGPVVPVGPFAIYIVDVRCGPCEALAVAEVMVVDQPLAAVSPDVTVCEGQEVILDASASSGPSCPGGLVFEWWESATLMRAADPDPTWVPPTAIAGITTYRVVVMCAGLAECQDAAEVTVTVEECPLAVEFGSHAARWRVEGGRAFVEVTWSSLSEQDTFAFAVERSETASGPFAAIGSPVLARGGGSAYRLEDAGAGEGSLPWYRVVEITFDGRGDATPAFRAREAASRPRGAKRSRTQDSGGRGRR